MDLAGRWTWLGFSPHSVIPVRETSPGAVGERELTAPGAVGERSKPSIQVRLRRYRRQVEERSEKQFAGSPFLIEQRIPPPPPGAPPPTSAAALRELQQKDRPRYVTRAPWAPRGLDTMAMTQPSPRLWTDPWETPPKTPPKKQAISPLRGVTPDEDFGLDGPTSEEPAADVIPHHRGQLQSKRPKKPPPKQKANSKASKAKSDSKSESFTLPQIGPNILPKADPNVEPTDDDSKTGVKADPKAKGPPSKKSHASKADTRKAAGDRSAKKAGATSHKGKTKSAKDGEDDAAANVCADRLIDASRSPTPVEVPTPGKLVSETQTGSSAPRAAPDPFSAAMQQWAAAAFRRFGGNVSEPAKTVREVAKWLALSCNTKGGALRECADLEAACRGIGIPEEDVLPVSSRIWAGLAGNEGLPAVLLSSAVEDYPPQLVSSTDLPTGQAEGSSETALEQSGAAAMADEGDNQLEDNMHGSTGQPTAASEVHLQTFGDPAVEERAKDMAPEEMAAVASYVASVGSRCAVASAKRARDMRSEQGHGDKQEGKELENSDTSRLAKGHSGPFDAEDEEHGVVAAEMSLQMASSLLLNTKTVVSEQNDALEKASIQKHASIYILARVARIAIGRRDAEQDRYASVYLKGRLERLADKVAKREFEARARKPVDPPASVDLPSTVEPPARQEPELRVTQVPEARATQEVCATATRPQENPATQPRESSATPLEETRGVQPVEAPVAHSSEVDAALATGALAAETTEVLATETREIQAAPVLGTHEVQMPGLVLDATQMQEIPLDQSPVVHAAEMRDVQVSQMPNQFATREPSIEDVATAAALEAACPAELRPGPEAAALRPPMSAPRPISAPEAQTIPLDLLTQVSTPGMSSMPLMQQVPMSPEVIVRCKEGHVMVHMRPSNDGWACDGRFEEWGCKSGITDFFQSNGMVRYECRRCNYDLCERCYGFLLFNEDARKAFMTCSHTPATSLEQTGIGTGVGGVGSSSATSQPPAGSDAAGTDEEMDRKGERAKTSRSTTMSNMGSNMMRGLLQRRTMR